MKLSYFGREHLDVTTTDSTGGTLDISFDGAATWHPLEIVDATHARILVAGPGATGNPLGTVVLQPGTYSMLVRLTRAPEEVVRAVPEALEVTTESGALAVATSSCYPDTTDWSCAVDINVAELDPVVRARSEALAWSALHRLTGTAVAICPTVIRPCAARCVPGTWYTAPVTGASQLPWPSGSGAFQPQINSSGQWVNSCGCQRPDSCSCTTVREVVLPGMVGGIVSVTLDGATLDPSAYRVDNGNRLVRQDGDSWPVCQDMNLPDTDPGAFVITYYDGVAPDDLLNYAAGLLALEFYKACTGKACQLPGGVTSVVKQGVSMEVATGLFTNGWSGIKQVDAVISIYNPFGRKARTTILSPDVPSARQRTWSHL